MSRALFALILLLATTAAATPEDEGRAIGEAMRARSSGFGDQMVTINMELRNAQGEEATRQIRVKVLERTDSPPATLILFDGPADVKGTALLSQGDDQWLYLPNTRRVRRISSSNRSGPFLGSELSFEDLTGNGPGAYAWKLLGTKPCGAAQCYEVETVPTYERSGYTRRVLLVEKESYRMHKIDYYDRKESLLKTLTYDDYKTYGQQDRAHVLTMTNHQSHKSTVMRFGDYAFGNGFNPSDFTKATLGRAR